MHRRAFGKPTGGDVPRHDDIEAERVGGFRRYGTGHPKRLLKATVSENEEVGPECVCRRTSRKC